MHAAAPPPIPPDLLLLAYRSGIFPMADDREDTELFWVEPRTRAVLPLDEFHLSRSLARTLRRGRFTISCNTDFRAVVRACAQPRPGHPESWISHRIEESFVALHRLGHATSFECRMDGELVGGLYGLAFDRVFCGESMFSRASDASKVALAALVASMRRAGYRLLDCQFLTDHLASLGACEIAQSHYLELVKAAAGEPALTLPAAYSELVSSASSDDEASAADSPGKRIAQSLTQTS
jgi:leucyl/phenylalanyl-tRNA--protein transferase